MVVHALFSLFFVVQRKRGRKEVLFVQLRPHLHDTDNFNYDTLCVGFDVPLPDGLFFCHESNYFGTVPVEVRTVQYYSRNKFLVGNTGRRYDKHRYCRHYCTYTGT